MRLRGTPTAGDIAADQTEESDAPLSDDSPDAADDVDATDPDPAPGTSLPSGAGIGPAATSKPRRPGNLLIAAVILGAVLAVVGAWQWYDAAGDPQLEAAADRDAVLIDATAAIETLNTLDYRDVAADLAAWEDVTTGLNHDQIAATDEAQRQQLADAKKIATGTVLDAAVMRLEGEKATVIAAVEVTVVDHAAPGSEPTLKRNRFSADLTLVGGEWKVENIQQVAVNLS